MNYFNAADTNATVAKIQEKKNSLMAELNEILKNVPDLNNGQARAQVCLDKVERLMNGVMYDMGSYIMLCRAGGGPTGRTLDKYELEIQSYFRKGKIALEDFIERQERDLRKLAA